MKRRLLSLMLVISIIASLITVLPMSASAETWGDYGYSNGYNYEISSGKAVITRFDPDGNGAITIPSVFDGYPVIGIAVGAFSGCRNLTSVNIPSSVTSIGESAFSGCENLKSITIPSSVTSIGESAFDFCTSLTSIVIPNGVKSINNGTFAYCYSLTNITIPSSVTSIGEEAFSFCESLERITIPNSITSIGFRAFSDCSSLTCINIPGSIISIGSGAFSGCTGLKTINISNGVVSIETSAFTNCINLNEISIPDSVITIGDNAFNRCSSLTSIEIPDSVTFIGDFAFEGCNNLTSINIPSSISVIGYGLFLGCSSLESIIIPKGVVSIYDCSFCNCTKMKNIRIPDSVVYIGESAFAGCSNLTDIYYGGSKKKWEGINIRSYDPELYNATIHCTNLEYTIKYNANGGSCVISSLKLEEGTFVPAPPRPTRDGYTFTGWYANRNCTGTPYISAAGITNRTLTNNLTLYAGWKKNDLIEWGVDTFSFGNGAPFFHEDCYISDEYYKILTKDLNWFQKIQMSQYKKNKEDGNCFGIVAVMALMKVGRLDPEYFCKNADTPYELPWPKKDPKVESLINYYFLTQHLPDVDLNMYSQYAEVLLAGSSANVAKRLVNSLKSIDITGTPVVINFKYRENNKTGRWIGHTVLAYKVEDNGSEYIVTIADPNSLVQIDDSLSQPGKPVYKTGKVKEMKISHDFKNVSYSVDGMRSTNDGTLRLHSILAGTNLYDKNNLQELLSRRSMYNPNLFDIADVEQKAELTTNYPEFTISDDEDSAEVLGENHTGNLDISESYSHISANTLSYQLANENSYTVSPATDMDNYETTIVYNASESLIHTESDKKPVISMSPDGMVAITSAEVGKKTARITVNADIPWNNVLVETNTKTLTLTPTADGVVEVSSDSSLKGAKITLNYESNDIITEISDDINEIAVSYAEEDGIGYLKVEGCEDASIEMSYTAVFASAGGSAVESMSELKKGDTIARPEDPSYAGFIFEGWYKDSELTKEWDFDSDTIEDNVTLYAKWAEDPDYHCLLSLMNGDEATQIVVTNGEVVGLDAFEQEFEKEGHLFLGWSDTEETATIVYGTKDTVTVTGDTTLYPVYKAMPCTVSNISKTDSGCVVNTKLYGIEENCTILVAGYKNGRLVTVKDIPYTKDEEDITMTEAVDMVSIMVWENFATAYPIADAEFLPVPEEENK
ncbi:MAG: hypothetical protein E7417_00480 [Ruminococcaceae bacterium]|nr:hypothetical protein [Oscillospiraceae bacterium]